MSGSWFIRLSSAFAFPDPQPPIINILCGQSGIPGQLGLYMVFYVFFVTESKLNISVLQHWFFFTDMISLLVRYACFCQIELEVILLISSVKICL